MTFLLAAVLCSVGGLTVTAQETAPRVFLLNAETLRANKQKITNSKTLDAPTERAFEEIRRNARRALTTEIVSLTTKTANPPSGDKRDYMSQAPYFWKNPDTKDGFPYVRRDGERNPEIEKYPDHKLLDRMIETTDALAVGFYFTGDESYAMRAAEILRFWFADEKTRMNPNLEYAQAIPGLNTGRGIGIIETRNLTRVADAVGLIAASKSWTKPDQKNLESWFDKYLTWLTTSKNGLAEAAAKNNHGTFYDVQTAAFALFVGKKDVARTILETAKQKRFAAQIASDGGQPLELERTKSWDYSVMNLDGLIQLAELGAAANIDLWHFQTADGRGLRRALEFLYQFKGSEKNWRGKQIEPLKFEKLYPLARRANRIYEDEKYRRMIGEIPPPADARSILSQEEPIFKKPAAKK